MGLNPPIVLSLCDRTGAMVLPWFQAGYECWLVDVQHRACIHRNGLLVYVGADVLHWLPPRRNYVAGFAFPSCTDQAVSGARWFKEKGLGGLAGAVALVERCRDILEWIDAPWMLENPVGTIASYWRKPDRYVEPWHFAGWNEDVERENYTKKTGLWIGNGFVLPQKRPAPAPHRHDIHEMPPSADRGDLRSVTPTGFARAVFDANHRIDAEGVA
jgi:hypothetical protein